MKSQLLKSIFFFAVLNAVCRFLASAQIVYTDVNPDLTCNTGGCIYSLDLNNDGVTDFTIKSDTGIKACGGMCHSKIPTEKISVKPSSKNGIVDSTDNQPSALSENNSINPSLMFDTTKDQILAATEPHCIQITNYDHVCTGETDGHWSAVTNKYLGFRIFVVGNYYYGWARLDVAFGGGSFTIKDYAYSSIPNQSILAGDTGKIATSIHNIKGFSCIAISPNPLQHLTRISFSLPQTEKASIIIYDLNGSIIKVLFSEIISAGNHQLEWNTTDENGKEVSAGIYFLQLQSAEFSQTEKLMVVK